MNKSSQNVLNVWFFLVTIVELLQYKIEVIFVVQYQMIHLVSLKSLLSVVGKGYVYFKQMPIIYFTTMKMILKWYCNDPFKWLRITKFVNCHIWIWLIMCGRYHLLMQAFVLNMLQVLFQKSYYEEKEKLFFEHETYTSNRKSFSGFKKLFQSYWPNNTEFLYMPCNFFQCLCDINYMSGLLHNSVTR